MQKLLTLSILVLVAGLWGSPGQADATATSEPASEYAVLLGQWQRPDGGYLITIRSVAADGQIEADYANPSPLPFAKAEASRDKDTIKLFFELQAGGYNGSTYTLVYDPAQDALRGEYYQAVAKQTYHIYFKRL